MRLMVCVNLRWVLVFIALAGACSAPKADQKIGQPCDVLVDVGPSETAYVSNATDCPSHMCLKPAVRSADKSLDTAATCSAPCSTDFDCMGSVRGMNNVDDKRCKTGFACAVPFEVGPQCCEKMCVCKDFLPGGQASPPLACTSSQAAELVCKPSGPISTQATPGASLKYVVQTDLLMAPASPVIDLLFLVDNSPGMDTKQKALADAFPALLAQLKDLPGGPPDLHIGIVSSDLGAGTSPVSGNCRAQGDRGALQMKAGCGVRDGATWLEQNASGANFTGDLATAFACAAQLGTGGCGYEQQLKAVGVALQSEENAGFAGFLRDDAVLGIVLLTDEDDCSADWNTTLFSQALPNETTSLRCATRGHICNGKALEYPTTRAFEANLSDCQPDDSGTALMPVNDIVKAIRDSKLRPSEQIVVGGIFGWPVDGAQNAKYRIGTDPNPTAGSEGKWDYLPICQSAALGKSYAGLRMKAFVDAFGDNGMVSSLCTDDLSPALKQLGAKLRAKLSGGCMNVNLIDSRTDDGLQPDCRVVALFPSGKVYSESLVPSCDQVSDGPCWRLLSDPACPRGLRMEIHGGAAGTQLHKVTCRTCPLPGGCAPASETD